MSMYRANLLDKIAISCYYKEVLKIHINHHPEVPVTIQPEPECDRCPNPVGKIECIVITNDGYGKETADLCEACRPESHYGTCDDCKQEFLSTSLESHPDYTVLPPNIKNFRLCKTCKPIAMERDKHQRADWHELINDITSNPRFIARYGRYDLNEHYFYDGH